MKKLTLMSFIFFLISCGSNNYEIIKEDINTNVCRIQIQLSKKESKSGLKKIALNLRDERKSFEKLWISFFLPDLSPDKDGNGAWAIASFTPKLEIQILGQEIQTSKMKIPLDKYSTITEMLESSGDFNGNKLEIISNDKENTHIRVSSEFLKEESKSIIKEQVKRDIVYIIFQTFAQTELNKVTVTSIPIIRSTFNPNSEYDGRLQKDLKETISISRSEASEILQKYLKTLFFEDLYQLNETIYLPNSKFDRLKHGELENVFIDLKKYDSE